MNQCVSESRPLYGIGTVARLTRLKPDTLRVWERRYGLGASYKSPTGRRQYTQADLEHLQLIAALLNSGSRIGEIASSDRKTLEVLCRNQMGVDAIPEKKARVLFIGERLCNWLDEHQGCLANVSATLVRTPPAVIPAGFAEELGGVDALVLESCDTGLDAIEPLGELISHLKPGTVMLCNKAFSQPGAGSLQKQGVVALGFPPEPARLIREIARTMAEKHASQGDTDLGELAGLRPREFSDSELAAARELRGSADCECPGHISDLIAELGRFEEYAKNCPVDDWHESAVHACIYTYVGQARWLMERALKVALEDRQAEFQRQLDHGRSAALR